MSQRSNESQTTALDYARMGRLGIGTPQANPTVEAEIRRVLPFAVDAVTLRLTSDSHDSATRLQSYLINLPQHAKQFAGMPIDVFLFACTATSYFLAPDLHVMVVNEEIELKSNQNCTDTSCCVDILHRMPFLGKKIPSGDELPGRVYQ